MIMKTMYLTIAAGILLVIVLIIILLKRKKNDDIILYTEEEKAQANQKEEIEKTSTQEKDIPTEEIKEKPKEISYTLDDVSQSILATFSVNDKILKYLADTTLSGGANTYYKDRAVKMSIYKNITEKDERVKVFYHSGKLMLEVELTPDYSKGIHRKYSENGVQLSGGPFSSSNILRNSNLMSTFKKAPLYIFILYGLLDDNMVKELEEDN